MENIVVKGAEKTQQNRPKKSFFFKHKKIKYVLQNYSLYLMMVPGMLSLLVFTFGPMFGLYMAFIDYKPSVPIFQNEFVGFLWFEIMFDEPLLWNMVANTLILSTLKLITNFPLTIVLALLVNEIACKSFKKVFQTVSYLPNFLSWIMVSGMVVLLLDTDNGVFNRIIVAFGGEPISWYSDYTKWRAILTISNLWKNMGWGTIMYIAAFTAIDQQLYEAATIDGAGRLQQTWHVTLPGIRGLVSIMLIFSIGKIFSDDFEQIYSLVGGNDILRKTTEVISTRTYMLANGGTYTEFPMATAIGLVQGIISMLLVIGSNFVAGKLGQETVW